MPPGWKSDRSTNLIPIPDRIGRSNGTDHGVPSAGLWVFSVTMDKGKPDRLRWWVAAALFAGALALFWRVSACGFVTYDDGSYVTNNPVVQKGLTLEGLRWALTTTHASNWHPLAWLSHMLDVGLFGLQPAGHHLTSALIHAVNTALLFILFNSLTGTLWRSALLAALFAAHPTHVESVAWVSERKDVLSSLFWITAMGCYLRHLRGRGVRWYLATVTAFGLGLLAKPMIVTLPIVLILLDYWPLGLAPGGPARSPMHHGGRPFSWSTAIIGKMPFFLMAGASAGITFLAARGHAMTSSQLADMPGHAANAVVSYARYMGKILWPSRLSVIYPYPKDGWSPAAVLAALALLCLVTLIAVLQRRRRPYLLFGWLWYIVTLLPVIGLVKVGAHAIADRYLYIPATGLFVMIIWLAAEYALPGGHRLAIIASAGAIAVSAAATASWVQVGYWRDSTTLFQRALETTRDNWVAHTNMGIALADRGEIDEPISHFRRALALRKGNANIHFQLALALERKGSTGEAVDHYREVLKLEPGHAKALNNLGNILARGDDLRGAIPLFRQAIAAQPELSRAHMNLGIALSAGGETGEGMAELNEALRLSPEDPSIYFAMGAVLQSQGRLREAAARYREALRLDPELAKARAALEMMGASPVQP